MQVLYNNRLNIIGLMESEWDYVLAMRIVYVHRPGVLLDYNLASELLPLSSEWTIIGRL